MQIPVGTSVKLSDNSTIFTVSSIAPSSMGGLLEQYSLIDTTTQATYASLVTIFDLIVVDNRQLYTGVLDFKIEYKKNILTKINKDLKKFRAIKKELEVHSSDEEEVGAFIESFKTEKSKDLFKLIKSKEHINFKKFLSEWV